MVNCFIPGISDNISLKVSLEAQVSKGAPFNEVVKSSERTYLYTSGYGVYRYVI